MNEESPRTVVGDGTPNCGVTREVTLAEVAKAVKKMKNANATGQDEIPVEAWKSLRDTGNKKLTALIQMISGEETMPVEWRNSVITLSYKEE